MKKNLILILACIFFSLLLVKTSQAAVLYFDPSNNSHENGQEFVVMARINLDNNEIINFIEGYINFPVDVLMVKDVSFGNSILTIIPYQPSINNQDGLISFSGGIPNGYSGKINGDPGPSNLLLKIIFQAKKASDNNLIQFSNNSQVYLNDGLATLAKLTLEPALINILPQSVGQPIDQWQQELSADKSTPEAFTIELQRDPLMFDNKWYIVFSTIDKQSGVDYFEVKEGVSGWQKTDSPYVLKNQTLKQVIQVKAVDKAGNETIESIKPAKNILNTYLLLAIIILLIVVLIFVIKKRSVR
ncbi:MAG: hypothetical protein PHV78_03585 [Patescibacteria group bacterium]|nr:hypothetical protein [Patescibacteria group bacterium]MDD5121530.1 hypothetical protein [Patescibacteria group bacterium]MDD5222108.1 hypothetical protein [Patescibacteria group bacterium]MDD5396306.1 hypothetical protein [Patescibacteria group bacterium]